MWTCPIVLNLLPTKVEKDKKYPLPQKNNPPKKHQNKTINWFMQHTVTAMNSVSCSSWLPRDLIESRANSLASPTLGKNALQAVIKPVASTEWVWLCVVFFFPSSISHFLRVTEVTPSELIKQSILYPAQNKGLFKNTTWKGTCALSIKSQMLAPSCSHGCVTLKMEDGLKTQNKMKSMIWHCVS